MSAPERIFARLDTSTIYMDGSSPLVARTREFRDSVEYIRTDIADDMLEAMKEANDWFMAGDNVHPNSLVGKIRAAIAKATGQ